jgi:phosphoglycolate phosphatase
MAGTTIRDDGLVEQAFTVVFAGQGVAPGTQEYERMLTVVRKTMGQSRVEVFRLLLDGDERRVQSANDEFEEAYGLLVDEGAVLPIPGAIEAIKVLRHAGLKVALTTGFARATQEAIVTALGWWGEVDLVLSPAEAGRGRPHPDLVLVAGERLGAAGPARVVVVGDTPLDLIAGKRAGAGLLVGVLTGAGDREALRSSGADHVIGSIGGLPHLLGLE